MAKTLSESAAEILKASMSAGKEPMQKMSGEVEDLGGATTANPGGNEIGKEAAADVAEAPKPGSKTIEGDKAFGSVKSAGLAKPVVGDVKPALGEESEAEEGAEVVAEVTTDNEATDDAALRTEMKANLMKKAHKSMEEDVEALFNGESLSEEFKTKATTIFEAAVNSRIDTIIEEMMTENDAVLAEAVETIKEEMSSQVDEYLNYVVEQWMEDNKVAIETGLRAELVDDFISGLKNLFSEHYIEIPEEKVDVAEELAQRVAALEEQVAARDAEKAAIVEELNAAKKHEAIRKICEGLTEVQIGKMKSLAEGVEFTTEGDYAQKLAVIRENYFSTTKVKSEVKAIQEATVSDDEPQQEEVHGNMKHYVNAISKTAPKA